MKPIILYIAFLCSLLTSIVDIGEAFFILIFLTICFGGLYSIISLLAILLIEKVLELFKIVLPGTYVLFFESIILTSSLFACWIFGHSRFLKSVLVFFKIQNLKIDFGIEPKESIPRFTFIALLIVSSLGFFFFKANLKSYLYVSSFLLFPLLVGAALDKKFKANF